MRGPDNLLIKCVSEIIIMENTYFTRSVVYIQCTQLENGIVLIDV